MIDNLGRPYRVAITLEKRHDGEIHPYETVTESSWHEPDGSESTDPKRIAELEAAQEKGRVQL